ncbi:hypothetical protein AB0B78_31475 [Streptomyces sp. NPDC040724]|uniref:hypothetical protein n=1 Tax=Streptomyces sp. NPDC040724 TaxID=3155612 RepID=UPI0033F19DF1
MRQVTQHEPQVTTTAVDGSMAHSATAKQPEASATAGPKIERSRIVVGYAAVVATLPYLLLKVIWVCGGSLGILDRELAEGSTLFVANLATMGMDGVAVVIALAFTHRWGQRLPAWLVLFPMWIATGYLAPIVTIAPSIGLSAQDTVEKDPDPFLASWVYVVVYGGFAIQGLLLAAAFVLYARHRWAGVFRGRAGEMLRARPTRSSPSSPPSLRRWRPSSPPSTSPGRSARPSASPPTWPPTARWATT